MNTNLSDKAVALLEETLDGPGMTEFGKISRDMERIFTENPNPTYDEAVGLITEHFTEKGEAEDFISKWIAASNSNCKAYQISEEEKPKAMLADLGMFRFMSFLEMQGFTEEQIYTIFAGAAEQVEEDEDLNPQPRCSCNKDHKH